MDKNGFIAIVFVFLFVSTTCNASLVFHLRKLIATEENNASAASQVSPIASPDNNSSTNTEKPQLEKEKESEKPQLEKQKESQAGNETSSNATLPVDPSTDNGTKSLGAPSPPAGEKKGSGVDGGNGKANGTMPNSDGNASCDGSISSCKEQMMIACIKISKDGGIGSPIIC